MLIKKIIVAEFFKLILKVEFSQIQKQCKRIHIFLMHIILIKFIILVKIIYVFILTYWSVKNFTSKIIVFSCNIKLFKNPLSISQKFFTLLNTLTLKKLMKQIHATFTHINRLSTNQNQLEM